MKRMRHRNGGLRKVCGCPRRAWPKCPHGWCMNYKPKGGPSYRLSIDAYAGKHIASKTEAAKLATAIKAAIDAGTFNTRKEAAAEAATSKQPLTTPDAVTLRAFGQTFLERAGKGSTANNRACLSRLAAFALSNGATLGDKALGAITEDDVEAFFAHLRREGRAASTVNKYVQLTRMLFRWAVRKKYLAQNPIADSEVITRERMAQRHRRLAPDVVNAKTGIWNARARSGASWPSRGRTSSGSSSARWRPACGSASCSASSGPTSTCPVGA